MLDSLIRLDKEGWRIYHVRSQANTILKYVYASGNAAAKRAAADLINYLGSRGYLDFGKILTQEQA